MELWKWTTTSAATNTGGRHPSGITCETDKRLVRRVGVNSHPPPVPTWRAPAPRRIVAARPRTAVFPAKRRAPETARARARERERNEPTETLRISYLPLGFSSNPRAGRRRDRGGKSTRGSWNPPVFLIRPSTSPPSPWLSCPAPGFCCRLILILVRVVSFLRLARCSSLSGFLCPPAAPCFLARFVAGDGGIVGGGGGGGLVLLDARLAEVFFFGWLVDRWRWFFFGRRKRDDVVELLR